MGELMGNQSKSLINFFRGWPNPSLLPVEQIKKASIEALSEPDVYIPSLLYAPDPGYEPLRKQLAAWLTDFYVPEQRIGSERICISGGASQNLPCILQVFSDPIYTRNIWMVSPTYFHACRIFEDSGFVKRLRSVPEDAEGIDIEYLRQGLQKSEDEAAAIGNTEPKFKFPRPYSKIYRHMLYAVPTSANPSSRTMSLIRRHQLVRLAREYDMLVIADDVYDQLQWTAVETPRKVIEKTILPRLVDIDRFMERGSERSGADGFGNVVSNGSFSKIAGPGCRTGWAEGTEKFAWGLSQAGSSKSGGAPSQLVASFMAKMLESGDLQDHIYHRLQPAYARRYRMLIAAVQEFLVPLGVTLPQTDREFVGGYFIWIYLPAPLTSDELASRAKDDENVIVAQGSMFGVWGDTEPVNLENKFRLCFAWEEELLLVEGVERLGKVVQRMLTDSANGQLERRSGVEVKGLDVTDYR